MSPEGYFGVGTMDGKDEGGSLGYDDGDMDGFHVGLWESVTLGTSVRTVGTREGPLEGRSLGVDEGSRVKDSSSCSRSCISFHGSGGISRVSALRNRRAWVTGKVIHKIAMDRRSLGHRGISPVASL